MLMKACSRARRRLLMLLVLCAGMSWCVHAEMSRPSLTVGPVLTYGYADIHEYVYVNSNLQLLSRLDWDVHNSLSAGGVAQFNSNDISFSIKYQQQFYCGPGVMQDFDWLFASPITYNPKSYSSDTLTEFSEHEADLKRKNQFYIKAGWSIFKRGKISLSPIIGFQYLYTEIYGNNGYLNHSPNQDKPEPYYSPSRKKVLAVGSVISYTQQIETLWGGVKFDFSPNKKITFVSEVGCSLISFFNCDDKHYGVESNNQTTNFYTANRYRWYHDEPESALMFQADVSILCSLPKKNEIGLSGNILYCPITTGNTSTNGMLQDRVIGGTSYLGWEVSLSYRIRIF